MFNLFFMSQAYAQTTPSSAQPSIFETLIPFILIFVIMYFLIIRPQGKQKREHQKLLETLKRGDKVLTASGILGTIEGLTDKFVTLEIADGVSVKILRSQIAGPAKE